MKRLVLSHDQLKGSNSKMKILKRKLKNVFNGENCYLSSGKIIKDNDEGGETMESQPVSHWGALQLVTNNTYNLIDNCKLHKNYALKDKLKIQL